MMNETHELHANTPPPPALIDLATLRTLVNELMQARRADVPRLALRPAEVAGALGICKRSVDELIARGELPTVRVGRARLVPVNELEAWISRRVEGGAR